MVPKNAIPRLAPATVTNTAIEEVIAHAQKRKVSVVALFRPERLYVPVERVKKLWLFDIQDTKPERVAFEVEVIIPISSIIFVLTFAELLDPPAIINAVETFINGPVKDMAELLERRAADCEDV